MPNSQIYRVFLLRDRDTDTAVPLFAFKQDPLLRPGVGDTLVNPLSLQRFKILEDEIPIGQRSLFRVLDDDQERITDDGLKRVTIDAPDLDTVTHSYFVTPADNPNRISSYTTNRFANDQTLKQLFR